MLSDQTEADRLGVAAALKMRRILFVRADYRYIELESFTNLSYLIVWDKRTLELCLDG